jgi:multidrug transporter EmrE-like cation transporter
MKRFIFAALALVMAVGLQPQAARAQSNSTNPFWVSIFGYQNPALVTPGVGLGIGAGVASYFLSKKHGTPAVRTMSPGIAYGVTSYACAVVYPFIGTVWLNRPLTPREAYVGMANCVVPVIGGWLVDAALPHDAWTDGTPARHHK